jgi:phage-related protein
MSTGTTGETPKPLFWVAATRKDLKGFPVEVRAAAGFALWQAQMGGKHVDAKVLKGFGGAGVLEVVEDHEGSTYRTVYTVKFAGAVYALHAFPKKSKKGSKTPKQEIDLIRKRLKMAEEHYAEWRATHQANEGTEEANRGG